LKFLKFSNFWLKSIGLIFFVFVAFSSHSQSIQQWYDNAQLRIDTLRKGSFGLKIYDKDGVPYSGDVKVKMLKHEYAFGIAFDFYEGEVTTDIPTEVQWMKSTMYKYFNYGVTGNSFKWSGIQPQNTTPNYTNFENALHWAQKVGWEMRGHTLLWGGSNYEDHHPMPKWVKDLPTVKAKLGACDERITRELTRYKGVVKEYDVINEALHANYFQSIVGDSLNWKCFEWAHAADPDARLFINDYNVEYIWGDADKYRTLIKQIIAKGGPVSGIGMQSHFWDCCRPDVTDFVTQINKLAEIGLPIRLTEFDYGGNLTEAEQAEDFIKVMNIAFSHPSIDGVIYWNLADHLSWRDNAGLFHSNHRPKLAADTLLYLTKKRWATNFETTMDGSNPLDFKAYYGDYLVEVQFGETKKQFNLSCLKANKGEVFELHEEDAEAKSPVIVRSEMKLLDRLELKFDAPIDAATINKANFRVFATNGVAIRSIAAKQGNDSILVLDLTKSLVVTDNVTFSYFQGNLASKQGGMVRSIGAEQVIFNTGLNQEPVFTGLKNFEIAENAKGGTIVGNVTVNDPEGALLSFKIVGGNNGAFGIRQGSGEIVLVNPFALDASAKPVVSLSVEVSDGVHKITVVIDIKILESILATINAKKASIEIYPNPAANQMHISLASGFNIARVYDLGGKMVWQEFFNDHTFQTTLNVNLENGVYMLKLSNGKEESMAKIIIQK
jgi:GH35 family endo-1,4-beta-xylanase